MREDVGGPCDSQGVQLFGWDVAVDEHAALDVSEPFHTAADGDVIVAVQPLGEGRVGVFMVDAG